MAKERKSGDNCSAVGLRHLKCCNLSIRSHGHEVISSWWCSLGGDSFQTPYHMRLSPPLDLLIIEEIIHLHKKIQRGGYWICFQNEATKSTCNGKVPPAAMTTWPASSTEASQFPILKVQKQLFFRLQSVQHRNIEILGTSSTWF